MVCKGDTMRPFSCIAVLVLAICVIAGTVSSSWARDYESRFMRNYPPGYYGMWYYAERFSEPQDHQTAPEESYRWDRYMSRITGLRFPFLPVPYDWDYGTWQNFNLPHYNTNDWP